MDNEYIRFENVRKEFPGVVALISHSLYARVKCMLCWVRTEPENPRC